MMLSSSKKWRVGGKIKLNVYEGNRPICQCHNEEDARRIVSAMNENLQEVFDIVDIQVGVSDVVPSGDSVG